MKDGDFGDDSIYTDVNSDVNGVQMCRS